MGSADFELFSAHYKQNQFTFSHTPSKAEKNHQQNENKRTTIKKDIYRTLKVEQKRSGASHTVATD